MLILTKGAKDIRGNGLSFKGPCLSGAESNNLRLKKTLVCKRKENTFWFFFLKKKDQKGAKEHMMLGRAVRTNWRSWADNVYSLQMGTHTLLQSDEIKDEGSQRVLAEITPSLEITHNFVFICQQSIFILPAGDIREAHELQAWQKPKSTVGQKCSNVFILRSRSAEYKALQRIRRRQRPAGARSRLSLDSDVIADLSCIYRARFDFHTFSTLTHGPLWSGTWR